MNDTKKVNEHITQELKKLNVSYIHAKNEYINENVQTKISS